MTHIRLAGIIAITLSLVVLDARSQDPGNGKGSQVTQAPNSNSDDNAPTATQDQDKANDPNKGDQDKDYNGNGADHGKKVGWDKDKDHDKDHDGKDSGPSGGNGSGGKWRTSATEIGTLGLLGASLLLASIYLVRRRSKARV